MYHSRTLSYTLVHSRHTYLDDTHFVKVYLNYPYFAFTSFLLFQEVNHKHVIEHERGYYCHVIEHTYIWKIEQYRRGHEDEDDSCTFGSFLRFRA